MSTPNPLHPGQACLECRRRKIRCDGVRPFCSRCHRLGKTCFFDPPSRRPQLDRMEEKVLELEQEAIELAQRPALFNHELVQKLTHDDSQTVTDRTQATTKQFLPLYWDASASLPSGPNSANIMAGSQTQGYGTVVARTMIDAGLQRAASTSEVPPDLTDLLTRILLPFRCQFHFYICIPRFLYCIRLPPSHPESPHPALLNAIFLAACNIGGGSMTAYEPLFLHRTRSSLEQSLAYADRLIHFMWANVILASYYTRVGRVVEAHNTLSATVCFAVGAGLHSELAEGQTGLTLPPADDVERLERVNLWFALTLCEASIGIGAGLPPSAPVNNRASLDALFFNKKAPSWVCEVKLNTKSAVLLHSVKDFIAIAQGPNGQLSANLRKHYGTLLMAHSQFRNELPSLTDPRGLQPGEFFSFANPDLVQAHLSFHVSTILLYNAQNSMAPEHQFVAGAGEKVLHAACSIAQIAACVRTSTELMPVQAHLTSVWYYYTACEVLIREMRRLMVATNSPGREDAMGQADRSLTALFDALLDLVDLYPFWQRSIRKLPWLLLGSGEYDTI